MKSAGNTACSLRPRNRDRPLLQRLSQQLEHVARKLRQLVQKQHPVVRQAHFARPRHPRAAADQARIGNRVVRRPERPPSNQARARRQNPRDAVDFVSSIASSCVSGGRMPAILRASMVLPEPGGPISNTLCEPAAATSSARFAVICPRTSPKSGTVDGSSSTAASGLADGSRPDRPSPRPLPSDATPRRPALPPPPPPRPRSPSARSTAAPPPGSARRHRQRAAHRPDRAVQRQLPHHQMISLRGQVPIAPRIASAIGKSNPAPSFRTLAGARLIVTDLDG